MLHGTKGYIPCVLQMYLWPTLFCLGETRDRLQAISGFNFCWCFRWGDSHSLICSDDHCLGEKMMQHKTL